MGNFEESWKFPMISLQTLVKNYSVFHKSWKSGMKPTRNSNSANLNIVPEKKLKMTKFSIFLQLIFIWVNIITLFIFDSFWGKMQFIKSNNLKLFHSLFKRPSSHRMSILFSDLLNSQYELLNEIINIFITCSIKWESKMWHFIQMQWNHLVFSTNALLGKSNKK